MTGRKREHTVRWQRETGFGLRVSDNGMHCVSRATAQRDTEAFIIGNALLTAKSAQIERPS
jgi:hypothetical protein